MTDPIATLPTWQLNRLVVLLDALGDVPMSAAERRSLVWLCDFDADTVENLAAVIRRSRGAEHDRRRVKRDAVTRAGAA